MQPGQLQLEGIHKTFQRGDGTLVHACDAVSLNVSPGEFVVLLGPSGCGKTTLLRVIAGLEQPDSGRVTVGGKAVFDSDKRRTVPPESRGIGMVFQSYALWPHMTVFENVAYPLRVQKLNKTEIRERVHKVLSQVEVPDLPCQLPGSLSGGQQQRVALARAIVAGNSIVLFDEPLSNVDAKVRTQLRSEISEMQQHLGFTAVYVTHDQQEAMSLATRLVVIGDGRVLQDATPSDLYSRPSSLEVARFIGEADEYTGVVRETNTEDETALVETNIGDLWALAPQRDAELVEGARANVVSRPNAWRLVGPTDHANGNCMEGIVVDETFQGEFIEVHIDVGTESVRIWVPHHKRPAVGDQVRLSSSASELLVYVNE